MPQRISQCYFATLAIVTLVLSACANTGTTGPYSESKNEAFRSFLVIGIAGDYDSRALFERTLVSNLRNEGASAQAWHRIIGGKDLPARDAVLEAVEEHGFDAVVVTRSLDTDTNLEIRDPVTGTKVSRKEGGVLDLFRYDYEELEDPPKLNLNVRVTFATELYSASSQALVWSAESTGPRVDYVEQLIDETADIVARQLRRAGKIAR